MNPRVFIIILNWNGKKDTLECLSSLKKISYKNHKIVLVDNGSTDGSSEEIRKRFPKVKIIKNRKNLGFAEGSNIGIKSALRKKTDYVLLLNNDTVVEKNFLRNLVKISEKDYKRGIVCPKVYFYSTNKLQYAGLKFNFKTGKSILEGYGEKDRGQFGKEKEMDFCGGTCMLVRKSVFENIGLLNEKYFAYYEDNDFGFRARNAGYEIIFCPRAKIWHKISRSTGGQTNPIKEYYMARNRIWLMKKYSPNLIIFWMHFIPEFLLGSLILAKKGKFDILKSKIKGATEGIWKSA